MLNRTDRTTMEGMIWNAHEVLEKALVPNEKGIPMQLFEKCVGVVIISVVEAGFIFTANVGSGIILKKVTKEDGTIGWSLPSACGLMGVGWGFIGGASLKDIIVFIMDELTLDALTSPNGLKVGGQAELTLGPLGRSMKLDFNFGSKGTMGSTIAVAFSKGFFGGFSIEGSWVTSRHECNATFYGKEVLPSQILNSKDVSYPDEKITLLNDVYDKLNKLATAGIDVSKNDVVTETGETTKDKLDVSSGDATA